MYINIYMKLIKLCYATNHVFKIPNLLLVGDQIGTGGKVRNNSRGKCFEERDERQRLAIAAKRGSSEYIPTCRGDGSYATVQCHLHTKSCWCVSRGGRPVPGSSVLLSNPHDNKRPNCAKYLRQGKSTTKRRSSHGKKNPKCEKYVHQIWSFATYMKSLWSKNLKIVTKDKTILQPAIMPTGPVLMQL